MPDWGHVLSVEEHALKLAVSDGIRARSRDEVDMKLSVAAVKHWWIRERRPGALCLQSRIEGHHHQVEENQARCFLHLPPWALQNLIGTFGRVVVLPKHSCATIRQPVRFAEQIS